MINVIGVQIKGKKATAICFTNVIEEDAIAQIREMCDQDFAEGCKVRIMPDVHVGIGCTIGTTMTVKDKVVPNLVGVDIGCGMYTVKLADQILDFEKVDEVCHAIPSGRDIWESRQEKFDLTKLYCYRHLKQTKRIEKSLGSLGGGNHFIEIDKATDGALYLIVHTGSRNLGKQVAEFYQQLAIDLHKGKETYFEKKEALIKEYKASGRRNEIQEALKGLQWNPKPITMPMELCFLYGKYMEAYLHDIDICQKFAVRNREILANIILSQIGITGKEGFHTVHNYVDVEERILRKGAIAAHVGKKVLIPINMRDGSILAVGKGNPDWNFSAPHGAGRVMSRKRASETLKMEEYKVSMEGIYSTSVNEKTLDESPMAYKSLHDIVGVIEDTVEVIDVMKPIYNFKASY